MRGKVNIINTGDDLERSDLSIDRVVEMATISVRYDDAPYPDNYDHSLKEGDDGYIEPVWRFEEEIEQSVLDRFGISRMSI